MKYKLFRQVALFLTLGTVVFLMSCEEDDPIDPPVARFTSEVDGAVVTFTNTSEGEGNTYEWNFGDGTTSIVESPTKTYTESGDFTVTLTATNGSGSTEASDVVTISAGAVDDQPPVITLIGDAAISVAIGEEFTDPGATAEDNVDGTITENIEVEGEVNTLQPGEYTITYNVSDAAGNAAEEVIRIVTVTFDAGLVTNGTFDDGTNGWIGNAANVQEDGGNFFNFANVEVAGNPFDVNLSQVIAQEIGNVYELSFNASTDQGDGRTILVGIGLNVEPFSNVVETVELTTTEQRFTYQFRAVATNEQSRILFDMGADVGVVVLDNISLKLISENTTALPINFETDVVTDAFNGAAFEVATDPDNEGNSVGKITNSGAQFEGVSFFLATPVDFSTDKLIKMKFNSPAAGTPVLMKFENGGAPVEVAVTAEAAGWQELTFDFSAASAAYSQMVIFVDGPGTSTGEFLVDDIMQAAGGSGPVEPATFPLDFEDGALFFSAFEGAAVAVIDNPDASGNTSAKVLELTKPAGVPFFAGINSDQTIGGPTIDLSNGLVFKLDLWSPKAGINVRVRLEQEPGVTDPPAYEIFQTSGAASTWETLTFDFSSTAATAGNSYTRLVINTDWDTDPAGGETFYIDNIVQEQASGGGGGGGSDVSVFCNTEVQHLGIPAETASAINLTIVNVDATSMKVTISSANDDAVDDLIVNNLTGPITGSPTPSAVDNSVSGELSVTLTWNGEAPSENIELNVLWSKASFDGNWQLNTENTTVAFNQTCN